MTTNISKSHNLSPAELLEQTVRLLLGNINKKLSSEDAHIELALMAAEALPLTSAEFLQVKGNLLNGKRYLQQNEWGAANYELTTLLRRLPRLVTTVKEKPARRISKS